MKRESEQRQDQLALQAKVKFYGSHVVNHGRVLKGFVKTGMIALFLCFASGAYVNSINDGQYSIDGISFENYPRVDGSTSTQTLSTIVACKLLGIGYEWQQSISGEWAALPNRDDIPEEYSGFYGGRIKVSQTHGAFLNLIEGKTDIILTQSTMSAEEKAYADELGVELIETSIALDAFIFLVNKENPVRDLTVEQIQRVYTGELTNWQQVGGKNIDFMPFVRPDNSGSQETMKSMVMGNLEIADFPESSEIASMAGVFPEIGSNTNAICYTFNFYKEKMVRVSDAYIPKIAVNGIFPDENTIKNKTYPFTAKVYAIIRSDLDHSSMAYKVYEWLQTEEVNDLIVESGFVPQDIDDSAAEIISSIDLHVFPNPTSDGFYIRGLEQPAELMVFDLSGRLLLSKQVTEESFVDIRDLPKGMYVVKAEDMTAKVIKK